jgi:nitrogen fixation protein NifU and related proteins
MTIDLIAVDLIAVDIARRKRQYRSLLADRIQKPRYGGTIHSPDYRMQCQNPICGDCITTTIRLSQQTDKIEQIKHEAIGCGISIASADLMAEILSGRSITEAAAISIFFSDMLLGGRTMPEEFEKLNALSGIAQFPSKIKCALLCWKTLDNLLGKAV